MNPIILFSTTTTREVLEAHSMDPITCPRLGSIASAMVAQAKALAPQGKPCAALAQDIVQRYVPAIARYAVNGNQAEVQALHDNLRGTLYDSKNHGVWGAQAKLVKLLASSLKTKASKTLRAYTNYGTARKAARGRPILRVGLRTYLVGDIDQLTQVEIISPCGHYTGQVGLGHLERLGNANHATPGNYPHTPDHNCFHKPPQVAVDKAVQVLGAAQVATVLGCPLHQATPGQLWVLVQRAYYHQPHMRHEDCPGCTKDEDKWGQPVVEA